MLKHTIYTEVVQLREFAKFNLKHLNEQISQEKVEL